jgi:esterase/lipase superfamily enzyme/Tfp pilus assembly protein PilF
VKFVAGRDVQGWAAVAVLVLELLLIPLLGSCALAQGAEGFEELESRLAQLFRSAQYSDAMPVAQEYVARARERHGEMHPVYATAISWLARVHRDQGRYAEALPYFEQALAIDEKALGPEHPNVGRDLNNIALLFTKTARYAEAEPLYRRAIDIAEKISPEHPDVSARLNNLAELYSQQHRYSDAEPLLERAVEITAKRSPQELDKWMTSQFNVVGVQLSLGQITEAERTLQRMMVLRERVSGQPDRLSIHALEELYWQQGRYSEAEVLSKRSLELNEKSLGLRHQMTITALNNLAALYWAQGRSREAAPLMQRALTLAEEVDGQQHPQYGTILNNLATLTWSEGRYEEAEPLYQRALAIAETRGSEHPALVPVLNNLGYLYEQQGKVAEAEPLYQRAYAIAEKSLGPEHSETATLSLNLGGLYKSQRRYADAAPLLQKALAIREKISGPDHPALAQPLGQIADLYRRQGLCKDAEPLFLRARTLGSAAMQEVPVLFGTDRKRDLAQAAVSFGAEREREVSLGLAIVSVPAQTLPINAAGDRPTAAFDLGKQRIITQGPTEAGRLAMHCIEVISRPAVVEAAGRRLALSQKYSDQALVFVHGYNVSFEDALRRTAQIAHDIGFDGGVFLFSWPSRGRFMDYLSDRETVDLAADHLREFIEKIGHDLPIKKIHFVAHSMGNMVVLRGLEKAVGEYPRLRDLLGETISAAPDVDPDLFALTVGKVNAGRGNVTLYASRGDKALWVSGWMRDRPRAGFIKDKPLITAGVDTIDITDAGSSGWYDLFALHHDVYSSNSTIVGDMRRIIESGKRPPDQRTPAFETIASKDGAYWRLRPAPSGTPK